MHQLEQNFSVKMLKEQLINNSTLYTIHACTQAWWEECPSMVPEMGAEADQQIQTSGQQTHQATSQTSSLWFWELISSRKVAATLPAMAAHSEGSVLNGSTTLSSKLSKEREI